MSADNGIYILQTYKNNELTWAVEHLQAIDNIHWNSKKKITDYSYINKKILKDYFKNSKNFKDLRDAYSYAERLEQEIEYVEYGIEILLLKHVIINW